MSRTVLAETYSRRLTDYLPLAAAFFNLEREVLPPQLVRPRPLGARPLADLENEPLRSEEERLRVAESPAWHLPAYEDV